MNNLFSIFDPSIFSWGFNLNWIAIMFFLLLPSAYWIMENKIFMVFKKVIMLFHMELKLAFSEKYCLGNSLFFIGFFILMLMNNFLGLLPYVFTSTSHLSVTLSISLSLWGGLMLKSMMNTPGEFLAHLVPLGTPKMLMSFMVLIEIVSNVIRPITLAVRMTANMIAGHLLLTLISSALIKSGMFLMVFMLSGLIFLGVLELAVSFIQSYVFTTLSSLYSEESSSAKMFK